MALGKENYDIILRGEDRTAAAFRSVQSNMRRSSQVATALSGALGQIGMTAGGGALAQSLSHLALIFTPGGLLLGGMAAATTAIGLLYKKLTDDAPTSEGALREHERLVGLIQKAYADATEKVRDFGKESREVALLQARQNALSLRGQVSQAASGIVSERTNPTLGGLSDMGGIPDAPMAMGPGVETRREFAAFDEAIRKLHASAAAGQPDIAAFRQEVAQIGLAAGETNPALAAQASHILKNTDSANGLAHALAQSEAMVRLLEGAATDADRKLLGLSETKDRETAKSSERVSAYQRVVDALQLELDNLGRTDLEQRIYNELARAGADAASAKGQAITALVTRIEAQRDALEKTRDAERQAHAQGQAFGSMLFSAFDRLTQRGAKFKDVLVDIAMQLARMATMSAFTGQSGPITPIQCGLGGLR